ncbi:TIGR02611 family protein [Pseudonocardia sp. EV170527-09]|uniref:TIGR02611 family protein n=1 Tax=Pseudonocardia sp. EV170527-09 TaxID=2603411 RepID=UPI0011F0EB23|nr:TIGR02611 family protein [Pseudonocardia sp. EV170527-09]KAA1013480.1 TIGR02611 family protein [Pseudonocardia sp. EV170527-09]
MSASGNTTSGRRYTGVRRKYRRAKVRYRAFRAGVARRPVLDLTYRITMGVLGTAIVIIGIIALPAPGPGWAIIFLGLGVLAAEFSWAQRLLHWVRVRYDGWVAWMGRQNRVVQLLVMTVILGTVAVCAWLFGIFATVGGWVGIHWEWLHSPLLPLIQPPPPPVPVPGSELVTGSR